MSTRKEHKDFSVFYTLQDHPVFMATLAKSGCTFLKNLFYYLDKHEFHPLGDFIHQDESQLLRAEAIDLPVIKQSPYVFMVIREPIDRFLSLYYEKIYGKEIGSMDWFRKSVGKEIEINFDPDLTLLQHQENTLKLIKWIGKNLRGETNVFKDFHWRKQSMKYDWISDFEPKLLVLDDLNRQLAHLLKPIIPDIEAKMQAVKSRNHSHRPFTYAQTRTEELDALVAKTYKGDVGLVQAARAYWQGILGS